MAARVLVPGLEAADLRAVDLDRLTVQHPGAGAPDDASEELRGGVDAQQLQSEQRGAERVVDEIKAAIAHPGCAILDVISPCVTFNDHEGSTKSYAYTRDHKLRATEADLVPPRAEIKAEIADHTGIPVLRCTASAVSTPSSPTFCAMRLTPASNSLVV